MADIDTKEVIDTETDTEIDEVKAEIIDEEEPDITYEQAYEAIKWVKDKEAQLKKAENTIIKLKQKAKLIPTPQTSNGEDFKAFYAQEKFYDKNPDSEIYRAKIEWYVLKWLTRDEWLLLASKDDRIVDSNREVYWKSIAWNSAIESVNMLSVDTFDNMTASQQDEYTKNMTSKYGKIKFK